MRGPSGTTLRMLLLLWSSLSLSLFIKAVQTPEGGLRLGCTEPLLPLAGTARLCPVLEGDPCTTRAVMAERRCSPGSKYSKWRVINEQQRNHTGLKKNNSEGLIPGLRCGPIQSPAASCPSLGVPPHKPWDLEGPLDGKAFLSPLPSAV